MQKNKGISLIVLVITIIVMIILAGSIIITLSNSGVINKANEAVDLSNEKQMQEYLTSELILNGWYSGKPITKELLEDIDGVTVTEAKVGDKVVPGTWIVEKDGAKTTIYETGDIAKGEVAIWDGTSVEMPEIKEGNWYIYTPAQFKFFAGYVNNASEAEGEKTLTAEQMASVPAITVDTKVVLEADLDLGARKTADGYSGTAWTPIGFANTDVGKFIGTFEGNNHVIRGVYVSTTSNYAGIFGNANTIQNLTIKDSYIKTTVDYAGGIVGSLGAGSLINCHNINTQVEARYSVGGVVGQFLGADILNCSNTGVVFAGKNTSNLANAGGVVGRFKPSTAAKIENCNNSGVVSGIGGNVGGVVGAIFKPTSGTPTVNNCINTGKVNGTSEDSVSVNVGGVVGKTETAINLTSCKNNGAVKTTGSNVAGIIGYIVPNGNIKNCVNTGNIEGGESSIGGIVGVLFSNIENCYNTGNLKATGSASESDSEWGVYGIGGVVGTCGQSNALVVKNIYNVGTITVQGNDFHGVSGIVGCTSGTPVTISNTYNAGKITITGKNPMDVGGIMGWLYEGTTLSGDNNYYIEGNPRTEGDYFGSSKTSAEMKTDTFKDLLNTGLASKAWTRDANKNSGYPVLISLQ